LYWARQQFEGELYAITFTYGQRHWQEVEAAKDISSSMFPHVTEHRIVDLHDYGELAKSALTTSTTDVSETGGGHDGSLPSTFTPGRNLVFLTIAASWAVSLSIPNVVTGVCQTDYSGYPDCRLDTIETLARTLRLGMFGKDEGEQQLHLHTPLMFLTKAETVRMARKFPGCWNALSKTITCYHGNRPGCRQCPACVLRAKGFSEAGFKDPAMEAT
jgi:7-cyano-7-deazaguanine synthase